MAATIQELAAMVQGRVIGDPEATITAAKPVTEAGPGDLTFLADERYLNALAISPASAVLIGSGFTLPDPAERSPSLSFIVVDDPRAAFMLLHAHLRGAQAERWVGIDPTAIISSSAKLGEGVAIYPYAVIAADAEIGPGCTIGPGCKIGPRSKLGRDVALHANVVLYEDVTIGDRCTFHAGVVIGADGFGYQLVDGKHTKVPQNGGVVIGDDVEIGANSCVDQGTFGPTRVGSGTKIDNLAQIGHNVRLGVHTIVCAQVGIGGSAISGDYVVMGGQVGIADHKTIGDGAQLCAQAGVNRDVGAKVTVFGTPAVPLRRLMEMHSLSMKLPEMRRQLKQLAAEVERLSGAIAEAEGEAPAESGRNSSAA